MSGYSGPASTGQRREYDTVTPTPTPGTEKGRNGSVSYFPDQYPPRKTSFSRSPHQVRRDADLQPPQQMDSQYMAPSLSPMRPSSSGRPAPAGWDSPEQVVRADFSAHGASRLAPSATFRSHQRGNSQESISWLDPIDESGGSACSSIHSMSSSMREMRRRHIRAASGDTEEAEFDAALDDAIEAAYNEGYEDEEEEEESGTSRPGAEDAMSRTMRKVQLARERVRESEREAMVLANERERKLRMQLQDLDGEDDYNPTQEIIVEDFYDGNDSEEEERLLEQLTRGHVADGYSCRGNRPQTRLPRESGSSEATNRTWHSSMGSNAATSTMRTTLSENQAVPTMPRPPAKLPPPPSQALPPLPQQKSSSSPQKSRESVRSRRLSGHNLTQLKIETPPLSAAAAGPSSTAAGPPTGRSGNYIAQQRQALSAGLGRPGPPLPPTRHIPSPVRGGASRDHAEAPGIPREGVGIPRSGSPARMMRTNASEAPVLRKNASFSSLRGMKMPNLPISHLDDPSEPSPGTPASNALSTGGSQTRPPLMPTLPTPIATAFKDRMNNTASGGLYLFQGDYPSPKSGSPAECEGAQAAGGGHPLASMPDSPAPLEPCPAAVSLRPFWLMRCLYQTLCHPRGGYMSNKLFVPRDVWRVRGVKLRNIEDKVGNCDVLTAALQRLARVDDRDADAVLEEMQALEGVLEQVQAALGRKLGGNEVGAQSAHTLFKEANPAVVVLPDGGGAGANAENGSGGVPRSSSAAKGSSFSWRRLRSKNSSAGLASAYGGKGGSGGGTVAAVPTEGSAAAVAVMLPSLPMAAQPTSKPPKRDYASVHFGGPNAVYMSSLARLFDAAQAIGEFPDPPDTCCCGRGLTDTPASRRPDRPPGRGPRPAPRRQDTGRARALH